MALEATPTPPTPMICSGFYVTPWKPDGYSTNVDKNNIQIVYLNHSPSVLTRYVREGLGVISFGNDNGVLWSMRCDSLGATVTCVAGTLQSGIRPQVRLIRYDGDILKFAAERGWRVGH
ncbi:MAG TPA: hypothetical protein VGC56_06040 [Allosphingosinicella sp.]|jgi:hypothetical protein